METVEASTDLEPLRATVLVDVLAAGGALSDPRLDRFSEVDEPCVSVCDDAESSPVPDVTLLVLAPVPLRANLCTLFASGLVVEYGILKLELGDSPNFFPALLPADASGLVYAVGVSLGDEIGPLVSTVLAEPVTAAGVAPEGACE